MKYRIKQTSKNCFLVQGSLEDFGNNPVSWWFAIDIDGEAFQPYRDKYYFENRSNYNFDLYRHNRLEATFISLASAKALLRSVR